MIQGTSSMNLDKIAEYIVPILILLFYLIAGRGKKKHEKQSERSYDDFEEEREEEKLPPQPLKKKTPSPASLSPPPVKRSLSDLGSQITSRRIDNNIEKRTFVSSISDERAQSLISTELTQRIDVDQAYVIKPRFKPTYVQTLLKRSTLKDAFILQEIFKKPDAF